MHISFTKDYTVLATRSLLYIFVIHTNITGSVIVFTRLHKASLIKIIRLIIIIIIIIIILVKITINSIHQPKSTLNKMQIIQYSS